MSNAGSPPTTNWWKFYAMWQWTSSGRLDGYGGNLDCNVFYGDADSWRAYARKAVAPPPVVVPPVVVPPVVVPPTPTPAPLPDNGQSATSWLQEVWKWIKDLLSKFTFKG